MRMIRSKPNLEDGFSLLELVVVVGILTIIMGAAFQLMSSSQISYDRNQLLAEAHQNADFATIRIAELVRGSGANPNGTATINGLYFVQNRQNSADAENFGIVRMQSDLDGDREVISRVTPAVGSDYFLLASEDVTLRFFPDTTTVGGVTVPGGTICMIDNTAGAGQGVPVVLCEHIVAFSCPVTPPIPEQVTLTITAGPSKDVAATDPRYITFTRTMQIRLRNRV
jgi:prepilin-type N-terminal cleavage/methylation domain-containing protein